MGGTDNIKGFDYQITYSLLKTIEIVARGNNQCTIKFESLDESEEDFNVFLPSSKEFHQLKKRNEGTHWTPSDLKEILDKFISNKVENSHFFFITDGSANHDVKTLRNKVNSKCDLSDDFLLKFLPESRDLVQLKDILKNTTILTRFFASDDENDPAKNLKAEVLNTLLKPPFELQQKAEICYSDLWKLVYNYARESKEVGLETLTQDFQKIGIQIVQKPWLNIPEIDGFQGRKAEIATIVSNLEVTRKLMIYGINGIGKTWIIIRSILSHKSDSICWLGVNRWTSIDRLLFLLTSQLYSLGLDFEAKKFHKLELSDRIPVISNLLQIYDLTLIIDSLNSANDEFSEFIKELLKFNLNKNLIGKLIIISTNRIPVYSEIDLEQNRLAEFTLYGFSIEDTQLVFKSLNIEITNDEIVEYHNAVGGHPMAIYFLKELIGNRSITQSDIDLIKTKSIQNSRDWIIEKSINQLDSNLKDYLLKLSIFEGAANYDEVCSLLQSNIKPQYLLKDLHKYNLVSFQESDLVMHDSIREVASNMLTADARFKLHQNVSKFYFSKMQKDINSNEGVLFEDIMKWGYHIERLKNTNYIEEKYLNLLNIENNEIDALWAIRRFGYPFDFETENLSSSRAIIRKLVSKKLIQKNKDKSRKYMYSPVLYTLNNLDFWDESFFIYICLSRGLSNHLGYILRFQPNYAWHLQHHACWWEHCIEFMPLPQIPKSERIEHIEFIKEKFKNGEYEDRTEEQKTFLKKMVENGVPDDAPEEIDPEMKLKSCPIFGHCCPDGSDQAQECRHMMKEDEECEGDDEVTQKKK
jgi:hypothetical protein